MEQASLGGLLLNAYDLGGMGQQRRIWKDYFPIVDAVVFVVDVSDPTRFPEAANELQILLSMSELEDKPVLVLGNKIDLPQAVSPDHVRRELGLTITNPNPPGDWKTAGSRPLEIFMCSIVQRMGYGEGLQWLSKFL
jgi:GTP-binding protein SAR1